MRVRLPPAVLYALPPAALLVSLLIGPSEAARPAAVLRWLFSRVPGSPAETPANEALLRAVIVDVRLPRVLLTFLVGGALATSGTALQSMFRNPLVSPYILGLSSGAAFGAALGLVTPWLPVQLSAFAFAVLAVGLSYSLARTGKHVSVVTLILAGIIVGGLFTAALTIVQFLTDPFKLQTIVHWTMGNLHNASWAKLQSSWLPMLAGIAVLLVLRWRLNVLALGDEEARAVGMNPDREKLFVLLPATLACSAAVSVAGVIGLFGLVLPHMVRMLTGPDNRRAVPACFLLGGSFLLIVDDVSRSITDFELPIGIFTTLLGAPVFVFLMKRSRIGWEL
jgi:iron complex transport system permease protein